MRNPDGYIMQDLADDPIPEIMRYRVTGGRGPVKGLFYAISAAAIAFVYLLAMAVAAN